MIVRTDLESALRIATGAVGEQRTVLSREFRELGEKANEVMDQVVTQAVLWVRTNSERIPSLQLAEWLHNVIWQLSQGPIDHLRATGDHAIDSLHQIAKELGSTDVPPRDEFEILLRGMPRFELATLPDEITVGHWKILGGRVVRSRIRSSLQESIGSLLKEELRLYGLASSRWNEQIAGKLETLVNSYADAYRVQIHRISGTSESPVDVGQLQSEVDLLNNWNAISMADLAEKLA